MNCRKCSVKIPTKFIVDGIKRNLQNRRYCLNCSPFKSNNRRKLELNETALEGAMRKCTDCLRDFTFRRHQAKTVNLCSACFSKQRRRKIKAKSVEYKGGKCSQCGYDKCIGAMDFHHLNPNEKDFTISGTWGKWENLQKELDKCVLLCKNCHAELHYF